MKSLLIAVMFVSVAIVSLSLVPLCHGQTRLVTFIYPPFTTGEGTGILERLITQAGNYSQTDLSWEYYPRPRAYVVFNKNKNNAIFLGEGSYFPDLQGKILTKPLIHFSTVFVYQPKRFPDVQFSSIQDLSGKRVGVTLGSVYIPMFQKMGLIVDAAPLESQIKKLHKGRIDFWHTVDVSAITMIDLYFPNQRDSFAFLEETSLTVELVITKDSSVKKTYESICLGFDTMKNDGTYKALLEAFYGKGRIPESTMVN